MLKPGSYRTKAADWGVSSTQNGAPVVVVKFLVGEEAVFWRGYFTEKSLDATEKALSALGFSGERFEELADGLAGGALNSELEVIIVVEHETYEGKTRALVKWVNEPNAGGIRNSVTQAEAVTLFRGLKPRNVKKRVDDVPF